MLNRRLRKDLTLVKDHYEVSLSPLHGMKQWNVTYQGVKDKKSEGKTFTLQVDFPTNYPFKPPRMRFQSDLEHPNITVSGLFCLESLKEGWSPAIKVVNVLKEISALLQSPDYSSEINPSCAKGHW